MAYATIDLSSITAKIESTFTKSIEPLIKSITGNECKGSFIDLTDQILTNAQVLWPMVQAKDEKVNETYEVPDLKVIVHGVKSFRAEVVYGDEKLPDKRTFLKGNTEDSTEKALGKLLEASMAALSKYYDQRILSGPDERYISITGGSIFVPKS